VGSCAVLRRTLFEQTPLGAGRNTFIHPSSKQATIAKQSKAKHSTAQHSRHGAICWSTAQSALSWMPSPPTASHWPTA
jgi:hypothetical protein